MDIEQIDSKVTALYNKIPNRYKYKYNTHDDIQNNSTGDFIIETCSVGTGGTIEELSTLLGTTAEGIHLAQTVITGSLDLHHDHMVQGSLRVLILLSDTTVNVQQEGVDVLYTKGSVCVLDTSKQHSAIIVEDREGDNTQRWLIIENRKHKGRDVDAVFKDACEYLPSVLC
jgi:cysteine synthase